MPSRKPKAVSHTQTPPLLSHLTTAHLLTLTPFPPLHYIDAYLASLPLLALPATLYMLSIGREHFQGFLSAIGALVGSFVLTVAFRMQVNPENAGLFKVSPERAFADLVMCHLVLFYLVTSFMD